jgi:hypothetical protein
MGVDMETGADTGNLNKYSTQKTRALKESRFDG